MIFRISKRWLDTIIIEVIAMDENKQANSKNIDDFRQEESKNPKILLSLQEEFGLLNLDKQRKE